MPKRKKGKTKSEAWKQMIQSHKRGPKRIRMKRETKIEDDDTILTQKIQLIIDKGRNREYIVIKISTTALKKLRLRSSLKLLHHQTRKHDLYPTFHALDHNAIVMGKIKTIPLRISTYCGHYLCEALVYGGWLNQPKTTIHITNTREEEELMRKTNEYVQHLFSNPIQTQSTSTGEYM